MRFRIESNHSSNSSVQGTLGWSSHHRFIICSSLPRFLCLRRMTSKDRMPCTPLSCGFPLGIAKRSTAPDSGREGRRYGNVVPTTLRGSSRGHVTFWPQLLPSGLSPWFPPWVSSNTAHFPCLSRPMVVTALSCC